MEENLNRNTWKSIKLALKFCMGILWKSLPYFQKFQNMDGTSMEDNPNGRQPQWKTTSMEDDLNVR
jgi:hypothetical protein